MSTCGKTVNRYVSCTPRVVTARFSLTNVIHFYRVSSEILVIHQGNLPFLMTFLFSLPHWLAKY